MLGDPFSIEGAPQSFLMDGVAYRGGASEPTEPASLQRVSDDARVGSFTIDSNGHYLLRLRNEYEINWDLDEYKVVYANTAGDSKAYSTQNTITLPNLMANTNIRLILSE